MIRNKLSLLLLVLSFILEACTPRAVPTPVVTPGQSLDESPTPAMSVTVTSTSRSQPRATEEPYPAWVPPTRAPLPSEQNQNPYPPPDDKQKLELCPPLPAKFPALSDGDTPPTNNWGDGPEAVLTIRNDQPFSGRAGDPKPDWLGWGAQAFAIAPDGSIWIADSAAEPQRLLHYSPGGELLRNVSLEGLGAGLMDVEVDENHLWALAISTRTILQFAPDGTFQASYDLPQWSGFDYLLSGIGLAEDGGVMAEVGNQLYPVVSAAGEFDPRAEPVAGFRSDQWLAPDGSYYIFTFEMEPGPVIRGKRYVRHCSPAGELLGELELPEPAISAQNAMAVGPDGALYHMISRADRSVEIWRLSFGGGQFPAVEATQTPWPAGLSPLLPAWETPPAEAIDLEIARQSLLRYFTYLHDDRYAEAADLYGGDYQELAEVLGIPPSEAEDRALVLESACGLLQCMLISAVVEEKQVAPDKFVFVIEFVDDEGYLFGRGACCGASPAEMPPIWQWPYTVRKIDGQFKVLGMPPYVP